MTLEPDASPGTAASGAGVELEDRSTAWFREAVVYQVFLDRFARGGSEAPVSEPGTEPSFCGGNLEGVIERLDYLEDLGVDTVLLSPFHPTAAYHGYHVTDFFGVDPRFGTLETLRRLIEAACAKRMRILMDFVPNHLHETHPFFREAQSDPGSDKRKWFYFTRWPDAYSSFLEVGELPKINLDHEPARRHLIEAALYWLRQGISGLRLDHAIGPSHGFWRALRAEVKKEFPGAVLIGEVNFDGFRFRHLKTLRMKNKTLSYLAVRLGRMDFAMRQYSGVLDGVLDFELQRLLKTYVAKRSSPPSRRLERKIEAHYARYPDDFFLPSFLDNHDMNRFLFEAGQNKERLKRAASIQFEQRQPPIIYYGTEVGLSQEEGLSPEVPHSDLRARRPMPWTDRDERLRQHFRQLIVRRQG